MFHCFTFPLGRLLLALGCLHKKFSDKMARNQNSDGESNEELPRGRKKLQTLTRKFSLFIKTKSKNFLRQSTIPRSLHWLFSLQYNFAPYQILSKALRRGCGFRCYEEAKFGRFYDRAKLCQCQLCD